jgi:WD40 repeat protein
VINEKRLELFFMKGGDSGGGRKLNVFISYSRDDLEFADLLDATLGLAGFDTTLDRRGIFGGEDWKTRLGALISAADTVVFVLSPSSVRSEICVWEVREATRLARRILPVLCRPLKDTKPPDELARLDCIYCYADDKLPGSGVPTGLVKLASALNTDLNWLRKHTDYLRQATDWDTAGRIADRLLRGSDIVLAKEWREQRPKNAPEPTQLQLDFINGSDAEEERQKDLEVQRLRAEAKAQEDRAAALIAKELAQKRAAKQTRRVFWVSLVGAATALCLAVLAGWFGYDATKSAQTAREERDLAQIQELKALFAGQRANEERNQALLQESRALTALSVTASFQDHYSDAVKLALAAWPRSAADDRPMLVRTIEALGRALGGPFVASPPLPHPGQVKNAVFSPNGARVVTISGGADGARLWDAKAGTLIGQPHAWVTCAAFSLNSAVMLTFSDDARVWDAATGVPIGKPLPHDNKVDWCPSLRNSDGMRVITASDDKTAQVWDVSNGAPIGKPMKHNNRIRSVAFSPDGTRVVTASEDNDAQVWDATTGAPIGKSMRDQDSVTKAAFSPDGARVVTDSGKSARMWDAATGAPVGETMRHKGWVSCVAFRPDGARLVTASGDNKTAQVWDATTGAPIGKPMPHVNLVWCPAFSPAPIGKPMKHSEAVDSAAFSPDGMRVVTASDDSTAQVWDAATGSPIGKPMKHKLPIRSAAFSPNGAKVVTASDDTTAQIWDAATGAPIGNPMRHGAPVKSATFSYDGALVMTFSNNIMQSWDVATGALVGQIMPASGATYRLHGAQFVTFHESVAQVRDVTTRAPTGRPLAHEDGIISAALSPDGTRLITATRNFLRVWSLPPAAPDIATTACKVLGDQDKADISAQFGAEIKVPICGPDTPAPDPKLISYR